MKRNVGAAIIILLIMLVFSGCNKQNSIVGTWRITQESRFINNSPFWKNRTLEWILDFKGTPERGTLFSSEVQREVGDYSVSEDGTVRIQFKWKFGGIGGVSLSGRFDASDSLKGTDIKFTRPSIPNEPIPGISWQAKRVE
jgi:hypothetical protein